MTPTPLGAVVVGTGFGAAVHVPALRAAGFEVRALVGQDPRRTERRAERAGVPVAVGSLDDALLLPGVDAVTIATPPHTHARLALQAIDAGKHVLCEKPFAMDASEARAMLAAAEAAGIVHAVGHEFRFAPDRALVARLIAGGAIGRPRMASLVSFFPFVSDPETRVPSWWFDPAAGGGWLGASGSHAIDQVRTWLGEIVAVSGAVTLVSRRDVKADDSFSLLLRTERAAQVMLQQSAGAWGQPISLTWVAGDDGTLRVDNGRVWLTDNRGERQIGIPSDLAAPVASDAPRSVERELVPYTRLARAFRQAILDHRPFRPAQHPTHDPAPATFVDGLAVQEVLDAIREAAARPEWRGNPG